MPAVISRGSNTYGPFQHPEKLIPHGDQRPPRPAPADVRRRPAESAMLDVGDHAGGIDFVLRHGRTGEAYNVPGGTAAAAKADLLLADLGKPWSLVRQRARSARPRPALCDERREARRARRTPRTSFDDGLPETLDWYAANEAWWSAVKSGDWDAYYRRLYGERLAASTEA